MSSPYSMTPQKTLHRNHTVIPMAMDIVSAQIIGRNLVGASVEETQGHNPRRDPLISAIVQASTALLPTTSSTKAPMKFLFRAEM